MTYSHSSDGSFFLEWSQYGGGRTKLKLDLVTGYRLQVTGYGYRSTSTADAPRCTDIFTNAAKHFIEENRELGALFV